MTRERRTSGRAVHRHTGDGDDPKRRSSPGYGFGSICGTLRLPNHAALAKAFCTAKARETVAWGRELLGGNGIVADYNVGRFFADAEALYSYEGTYQMQNLIVGKAITGFGAFV